MPTNQFGNPILPQKISQPPGPGRGEARKREWNPPRFAKWSVVTVLYILVFWAIVFLVAGVDEVAAKRLTPANSSLFRALLMMALIATPLVTALLAFGGACLALLSILREPISGTAILGILGNVAFLTLGTYACYILYFTRWFH